MSQHRRKAHGSDARRNSSERANQRRSGQGGYPARPATGRSSGDGYGQSARGGQYGGHGGGQYGRGGPAGGGQYGGRGGYGGGGSHRDGPGGYGGYGGGQGGGPRPGPGVPEEPDWGGRDNPSEYLGPSSRTYGARGEARPRTRAEARRAAQSGRGGNGRGGGRGGNGGTGGGKGLVDYPRAGRTGLRRWIPSWQLVTGLGLGGFIAMLGAITVVYATTDIPDPNANANYESTVISYSGGQEMVKLFQEQRTKVDIGDVPPHVQSAVLAAENRTFYTDSGVSPKGMARALYTNLRGGSKQGGSTITQQLAKNMYLTQERTVSRKFNEFFLAIKLDQEREKKQILEDYLNTIFWGRRANGIQAASQAYFGIDQDKLSIEQGALLAGIIRGPSLYDPWQGETKAEQIEIRQRLEARFRFVLDGMVKMGTIAPARAAQAKLPDFQAPKRENRFAGQTGYLVEQVKKELRAVDKELFSEEKLNTAGYQIKTTFNEQAMLDARKAVEKVLKENPKLRELKGARIGLAAVDPKTGAVVATYGGADYLKNKVSNATQAQAQPGSTFKAFALAAAFGRDEPVLLQSRFAGLSPWRIPVAKEGERGAQVRNEENTSYARNVDLLTATKLSINTAFVDLTLKVGPENIRQAAVEAGIPDTKDLKANTNARIPLGIHAVRVVDMAAAYATFANEGVANKPYVVEEVKDANGKVIHRHKSKPREAFDEAVVTNVDFALEQVINGTSEFGSRPSGWRARDLDRPAAGKTGTAETADPEGDNPEVNGTNTTAWFTGYTPDLSTAVAIFRDLPTQPLDKERLVFGSDFPTKIWTTFMKGALEGKEATPFPERVELENGTVINPAPKPKPKPDPEPTPDESLTPDPNDPGSGDPSPGPTFTLPIPDPNDTGDPDPDPTETEKPDPTCQPPFCQTGDPRNRGRGGG
jgi:membrane peptidoglycan carboxypeptidase